jgi:hypothetical protein
VKEKSYIGKEQFNYVEQVGQKSWEEMGMSVPLVFLFALVKLLMLLYLYVCLSI